MSEQTMIDRVILALEEADHGSTDDYRSMAVAAIEAMRPDILRWAYEASGCTSPGEEAEAYFRGMIDASLSESGKEG